MSDWQHIDLPGADVTLWPHWLATIEADALFAELRTTLAWENHRLRLFGRDVASPRLSVWIGDPDAVYTYSRRRFEPQPWPPVLAALRPRVEQACGARFNSVLANLYRDGNDAMGWHSDDELELGAQPVIASLSLGAVRRFCLRRRVRGELPQSGDDVELRLPHGSLLRMAGDTQRLCRHALPRMRKLAEARINLTFRHVDTPPA